MSSGIHGSSYRRKVKKSVLLVDENSHLLNDISTLLEPYYDIYPTNSIEQAFAKIQDNTNFHVVVTNLNFNSHDHSLMEGLSVVRYCEHSDKLLPVIVYTADLHPLVEIEARSCGTFRILDQSHPEFKRNILNSINFAIKIYDWKIQFVTYQKNATKVKNLLNNTPFISPINWNYADENLYHSFFLSDTSDKLSAYHYANSWAYICQAARNNGHKFFNGNTLITIATKSVREQAPIEFEIINPLGQAAVKHTLELAEQLKDLSGNPVLIKKVSESQVKYLLRSPQCHIFPGPLSKRLEDQYDDIYPQVVVNLKAFMNSLTSNKMSGFRTNLKKFSQRNYSVRTTTPELFEDFWDVVLKWKQSFIRRYEERDEFTDIPHNDDYYINGYFPIFEYYSKNINNRHTLSSLVYVDEIPVGFSFFNAVSKICMGMYANLADTDYEGASEFMLYHNLTKAYLAGYEYVNLGGTESKYLYNFYNRLKLASGDAESFEIKTNYLIYE